MVKKKSTHYCYNEMETLGIEKALEKIEIMEI